MDDDRGTASMAPGERHRLRYRSETRHRDRTAVMIYLGEDGDQLLFDARPAAGTQRIPRVWILGIEPVPANTPAYLNRVVR